MNYYTIASPAIADMLIDGKPAYADQPVYPAYIDADDYVVIDSDLQDGEPRWTQDPTQSMVFSKREDADAAAALLNARMADAAFETRLTVESELRNGIG